MFSAYKYIELWKFSEVSLRFKIFEKCQNFEVSDIRFSFNIMFNFNFHSEYDTYFDLELNSKSDSDSDSDSYFNLDSDLSLNSI